MGNLDPETPRPGWEWYLHNEALGRIKEMRERLTGYLETNPSRKYELRARAALVRLDDAEQHIRRQLPASDLRRIE